MKSGTCPKCDSTEILCAPVGGWHGLHQIHIEWLDAALVQCLVCAACGYVESYVHSDLGLRKMRRAYERYRAPHGSRQPEERGDRDD